MVGYLVTVLFGIVHNEATYSYSLLSIILITKLIRQGGTYFNKDPYSPPPREHTVLISTRTMSSVLNRELRIKNNRINSISESPIHSVSYYY